VLLLPVTIFLAVSLRENAHAVSDIVSMEYASVRVDFDLSMYRYGHVDVAMAMNGRKPVSRKASEARTKITAADRKNGLASMMIISETNRNVPRPVKFE
jgi:hypothetical protein